MKWMTLACVTGLFVLVTGCTNTGNVKGEGGKKLQLTVPSSMTVKQGETRDVTVKIERTKFDDDVNVTFDNLPKGVSVKSPEERKIPKGSTEKTYTLAASKDATAVEGQKVKVSASSGDMKVEKTFTLNVESK